MCSGAGTGAWAGFSAAAGASLAAVFFDTAFLAAFFATAFFATVFFATAFLATVLRAVFFAGAAGGMSKRSSVVFLLILLSLWGKGSGGSESVLGEWDQR